MSDYNSVPWTAKNRADAQARALGPELADLLRRLVSLESEDGLPLSVWGLMREARPLLASIDGDTPQ